MCMIRVRRYRFQREQAWDYRNVLQRVESYYNSVEKLLNSASDSDLLALLRSFRVLSSERKSRFYLT